MISWPEFPPAADETGIIFDDSGESIVSVFSVFPLMHMEDPQTTFYFLSM